MGFLDSLTADLDTAAANRAQLRGLGPALQATGIPTATPGPTMMGQLFGVDPTGTPSAQPGVLSQLLAGLNPSSVPQRSPPDAPPQPLARMSAYGASMTPTSTATDATGQPAGGIALGAMAKFADAIKGNESGGDYGSLGPVTDSGDRAHGAYQVMGANIAPWTKEVLGQSLTPEQFLSSPQAQDAVFQAKFGQSLQKYGNPADAASVWFTGKPMAQAGSASDQLGTTAPAYVSKFMANLRGGGGQGHGGGVQPASYSPGAASPSAGALSPQALAASAAAPPAAGDGGPSLEQIKAMVQNPATQAQGLALWQQSVAAGRNGQPRPGVLQPSAAPVAGVASLPGGLNAAAIGAMIQEPATRDVGLRLWQNMLSPQITSQEPNRAIFANGKFLGMTPSAPMDVAPGNQIKDPNTGATLAAVPPAPVKLGSGEALVPPTGGAPIAAVPPALHFSDVNGRVVGSDPRSGASADVTPAGVPSTPDLKATEEADKDVIGKIGTSKDQAVGAVRTLDAIQRQQEALDKGVYTGGGADTKLAINNTLAGILGIDADKVANTQEFIAAANSKAAEIARQLSQSGHTTNADLNMAKVIGGADINYSKSALREIGRAQQQLALDTINRHNAAVDGASRFIPAVGQRSDFYKVQAPRGYNFAASAALTGARQAIARGAPRAAVIQRLQSAGIDTSGL